MTTLSQWRAVGSSLDLSELDRLFRPRRSCFGSTHKCSMQRHHSPSCSVLDVVLRCVGCCVCLLADYHSHARDNTKRLLKKLRSAGAAAAGGRLAVSTGMPLLGRRYRYLSLLGEGATAQARAHQP